MKRRKGKLQSINFDEEAYGALSLEVEATDNNYSQTINRLIRYTLALDNAVKSDMAIHAYQKAIECQKEADEETGFTKQELLNRHSQYMNLVNLFTSEKGLLEYPFYEKVYENMQTIPMQEAQLICPNDWIYLQVCNEEEAVNAFVVEFKNSRKFSLPHFVFLTDTEKLDEETEQKILDEAAKVSPEYKKVSDISKKLWLDSSGNLINAKTIKEQPVPGFFKIPRAGTTDDFPYGAMVLPIIDEPLDETS